MKKSLIAIAALAAVGAASAQSSVTLYGLADVNFGTQQFKVDGVKEKHTALNAGGNLNGSRLGVKGVEDLGNGLKAVFNYELGFDSANGNFLKNGADKEGFGRRAVVGLQGSFGSVLLGRDNTPVYNLITAVTADAQSDFDTGIVSGPLAKTLPNFTNRADGIHYAGNFSGVGIQAFAGYDKTDNKDLVAGDNGKKTGYGLGLSYANGPFMIGAAGQQFKSTGNAVPSTDLTKETQYLVGGSYDFNVAKVFANYTNYKNDYTTGDNARLEQANLGVTVPFGATSLVAEYGRNRLKVNGEKFSGNDFMLGANYAFSKRTDVYARIGQQDDLKIQGERINVRKGAVGIRHRF